MTSSFKKKVENDKVVLPEITIYAMPGSQFTGKVLAALDARKIPHYCVFVPIQLEQRKAIIPSGGTYVPEMKAVSSVVTNGDEKKNKPSSCSIVPDSEAILHWLDDNLDTQFYPTEQVGEISIRASTRHLAGSVWYFNWVDDEGYNRSMKKSMAKAMLPSYLPVMVSEFIVNLFLGSIKDKYRQLAMEALGGGDMTDTETKDFLSDRSKIRDILLKELHYFQSLLTKTDDDNDQNPYLLGNKVSTAADFSVYVQVERLVGDMGDTNILPSIPELKDETTTELERFWKWHTYMRENHPLVFKGKRSPRKG